MRRLIPPAVLPLVLPIALAGCTLGPDYAGPPPALPPAPPGAAPGFARAGGDGFSTDAPAPSHWWRALGDPLLDELVAQALAANPDVAAAQARIRQARAALREQRASGLPSVNASAIYAHARLPGVDLAQGGDGGGEGGSDVSTLNFYNLGFDASWEVDLFGGQRRGVEAARATGAAAQADLADMQVSLAAEVAQTYVTLRDRQRRIVLGDASVRMQQQALALTRQRLGQGTASQLDIVRLEGQLDSSRADLTPLSAQRDASLDALAVLTGQAPGLLDTRLAAARPLPLPPAGVAIGDPQALLARRPDIRAAERRLAAETARIGQAEAARFPRISFLGIVGLGGTAPGDLTDLDNFATILAPRLSWSFLDFGRGKARVTRAEAVRDEAEARYRGTILAALRDAEDSLSRFRYRRQTVATLARARAEANEAVRLTDLRYQAGTTTLIDLLDARRRQIAAEQGLSEAEAGLTGDFIAIQKALGLGWSA